MEERNKLQKQMQDMVGMTLDDIRFACEMMMFSFGEYELHAQCFTRIILRDEIIATTLDYQSWDGENTANNDAWYHVTRYKDRLVGGTVETAAVSPMHDVVIAMDNGVRLELFIGNGYVHFGEDLEQWVFFKRDDRSYPFVTVYGKSVETETE